MLLNVERSISMLKRVKTGLRSNMTESRLNGLALLQYHRNISVTADQVVQEFVRCHPRRLLMVNPFEYNYYVFFVCYFVVSLCVFGLK